MTLIVKTASPRTLISRIEKAIHSGDVTSWEIGNDGKYTHKTTTGQWYQAAWLQPEVGQGQVKFVLLNPNDVACPVPEVRGVYEGRFIEMLITHFDSSSTAISAI